MATTVLYDFCLMSALFVVSKIIRAKVRFIQRLYIPTALIAGFLGLLLGKQGLGWLPFSSEIGNYSGILIAVLFGTMFLGNKGKSSFKKMFVSVGETFLVNCSAEVFQFGFFMFIGTAVLPLIFGSVNKGFGLMLPAGFVGGHGTAAAIGDVLSENGWKDAVSIGQTFATIGLLVGILGGVVLINIAARKGQTKAIKSVEQLPEEMLTGLIPEEKRDPVGEETTSTMSIDVLSWHLGLVLTAVGAAYLVNMGLKKLIPQISFPTYALALICSILLHNILHIFKLDKYVDKKTVTHIGAGATDYLVGFGVASINLNVIVQYWQPLVLLVLLGIAVVLTFLLVVSRRFFSNYWFERGIYIYGMSTGVLATGAILLRIADPEFKTGVLEDFGFAWIFMSVVDMLCVSLCPLFVLSGVGTAAGIVLIAIAAACLVICKTVFGKNRNTESV